MSELLLRTGVRTVRFAQTNNALEVMRYLTPALVLFHIPQEQLDAGWAYYARLLFDPVVASMPVLLYTSPFALHRRLVGGQYGDLSADGLAESDMLTAQVSSLIGATRPTWQRVHAASSEQPFPTGRDDL
jgi:hypothetical protein